MKRTIIKIMIALIMFIIALVIPFSSEWINNILYFISYLIVGLEILKEAIKNIFKGELFDENFLMAIATIGAFAIGEFPEAVAVMLFYQIGELFQTYAVDKSRKSIASLMNIRPDYANLIKENKVEKVKPEEVKIGQEILIKPGEKIPLDGVVVDGTSMLDTSALTGESVPRRAIKGDKVLSGCINQTGVLTVKILKEYGESTVNKILDLVENASNKKSKSENFIRKFAKYYTPAVVIIAVALAVIPPFIFKNSEFIDWLYRALTFLVVSCPCALVLSIPLSFFGGIGGASKKGILVKGSSFLEALSKTEIVIFDKTGTLTQGVFDVQKVNTVEIKEEELLKFTAHAEIYSNHPIGMSIKKFYGKEMENNIVSEIEELSGLGILAKVEGKEVLVGNENLMKNNKIQYKKSNEFGTIIYVAIDKRFAGTIIISDKIKEDSKKAINDLKKMNIKNIIMLTGDKKEVGEYISKKIGIDKVYAELLPTEKVQKVEKLLKEKTNNGKLTFVGDGVNDAPALALADIGIAMGGLGADSAIEAADIVIMTDEPSKIKDAMQISKKTMRIVKQNIIFAIVIKIGVLILSAMGLSTMWEAVFADVGVSVIAIINSLRALNVK